MIFRGYSKIFSTVNNKQYELIGEFWDDMTLLYNIEELKGLGFNWTETTIEYIIGLKNNEKFDVSGLDWKEISLPDIEWETVEGKTSDLNLIYNNIY